MTTYTFTRTWASPSKSKAKFDVSDGVQTLVLTIEVDNIRRAMAPDEKRALAELILRAKVDGLTKAGADTATAAPFAVVI